MIRFLLPFLLATISNSAYGLELKQTAPHKAVISDKTASKTTSASYQLRTVISCLDKKPCTEVYPEWKKNKVNKNHRKKTYISIINEPAVDNVKNVVFIAAGQQTPWGDFKHGYPNVLTGQSKDYRRSCDFKSSLASANCRGTLRQHSLAEQIYKSPQFPLNNTLIIAVFDTQYNYQLGGSQKLAIQNAFWEFLTKRFNAGKVEQIVLSGQSRGGCLAFQLGKRLRNTQLYSKIPLVIQGYDPVCTVTRIGNELGIDGQNRYFHNPLFNLGKSSFKSVHINMDFVFPTNKRKNLAILDIHSGAPVFAGQVHSFTFKPQNADLGWWKQTWVPYEHKEMGGNMDFRKDTVIPGFQHIKKHMQQFAHYQPPGGTGQQITKGKCPTAFPKKIAFHNDSRPVCKALIPNKIKTQNCTTRRSPGTIWGDYCIWSKNNYWHARPLKGQGSASNSGSNGTAHRCPVRFPKNIGTHQNKPICRAALPAKIKPERCNKKGGMTYSDHCLWGKNTYWHARPLKD